MSERSDYIVRLTSSLLTMLLLTGKPNDAKRLAFASQVVVEDKCEECPSYCDETGAKHDPINCRVATTFTFCCNFGVRLDCCSNDSLKITNDISDGFHCPAAAAAATYNRTILSICVSLGFACFVGVVVLFIYQAVRRRRRRGSGRRRRRRSDSSHFDRRSSSNASCSTRSSRSSVGSSHCPQRRDSISNGSNRQQQQQQQQQQQASVVISASNLDDGLRISDDVLLRVFHAVPTVSTAAETCFIIQSTVYPPPYTDETPPPYSDIFPS